MTKCLLTITISVLVLAVCSFSRAIYELAKPGCNDHCGDVKIPYPFGIENSSCYSEIGSFTNFYRPYKIICDRTTKQPKPFIVDYSNFKYEVLSINVDDHSLRLSFGVAFECYTSKGLVPSTTLNNSYALPILWPFKPSTTRNRLIAVGCDTIATFAGRAGEVLPYKAAVCISSCTSLDDVDNGTCSSRGCCETPIYDTDKLQSSISVGSFANHSYVAEYNPCSYALLAEVGSYNVSIANLTALAKDFYKFQFPVVYDWSIMSNLNCTEARKAGNESFVCGANAQCIDVKRRFYDLAYGCHCQCLKGYVGNPYLSHGCQDIDECLDEKLNQCQKPEFCVNKKGGFECRCPEGFHGSGTSNNPCINNPPSRLAKLVFGLSIGTGSMIGFILLYGVHKKLKRRKDIKQRKRNFKKNGGLLLQQKVSTTEGAIDKTKIFSQIELEKATNNFNKNSVLGHGGQGTVYKGMLADGTIVAVKMSKKVDELQLSQFINEVAILSQINHRNVVKLFGCCLETEVPLLVYEFVPNGTLYQHIHYPTQDFHMTWKVRFQIAVECAGAIAYLHSSCSSPIYHRDIKSSNILLDEKFKAKVSDFGTSKSISIDKTHVTTFVQGTFGYLDPEFFQSSQFSEKSDVYSFGVVLLELFTSKKPFFTSTDGEPRGLVNEFLHIMKTSTPNKLDGILDAQVLQNCLEGEVEALAKLMERCLSMNGSQRPTMREVATTLEMIKSKHDKNDNLQDEQGIIRQQGHAWKVSMSTINEDPSFDISISLPR